MFGGGGITPDLFVLPEALALDEARGVQGLFRSAGGFFLAVFAYAVDYVADHPDLEPGFSLSDADMEAFFQLLPEHDAVVDREDFEEADRFVRYRLEQEIAVQAWGEIGPFQQLRRHDRQLSRAIEVLQAAETPAELLSGVEDAAPDGGDDR